MKDVRNILLHQPKCLSSPAFYSYSSEAIICGRLINTISAIVPPLVPVAQQLIRKDKLL